MARNNAGSQLQWAGNTEALGSLAEASGLKQCSAVQAEGMVKQTRLTMFLWHSMSFSFDIILLLLQFKINLAILTAMSVMTKIHLLWST